MSSWRDRILREFTSKVSRLTLVADPDGLLLEEGILAAIQEQGFEVIPFEDHVAFRYAYESKFRSQWDEGKGVALVVVLPCESRHLNQLPYDLLQVGRRLSFSLGEIFPHLSYPIVAALDRGDLDPLDEAQRRYAPGLLGDNATKDFILRHVFEIAPELIKEPKDLLRVLLRRHYRMQRVPPVLDERFIELLKQNDKFKDWPLESIVPDRDAFFAFLQERWPAFVERIAAQAGGTHVRQRTQPYDLTFNGPVDLPFDDGDVRVYLDNLFAERLLQPTSHEDAGILRKTWVGVGIHTDPAEDRARRLNTLIESVRSCIPAPDARHESWLRFARQWAELTILVHRPLEGTSIMDPTTRDRFSDLRSRIDAAFTAWLVKRYSGLSTLPAIPPAMVHHIPRYVAHHLGSSSKSKVALVVVDGLALDQWIILRDALKLQRSSLCFREAAVFAWIPTVTSISRQAAFSAKPPILFPASIHRTDNDSALWTQFWVGQRLSQDEVLYLKRLGDGDLQDVAELLSDPRIRVSGLVIEKVDRIMHGMELGMAGMHNQVHQWACQPYLGNLLKVLHDHGFLVFLTSDHGNIEAEGCGRPTEGAVADARGERVRIYSDTLLRDRVHARFRDALKWEPVGLPQDCLPLIAPGRAAFVPRGERVVSHGGICIEEVIVPFVQIEEASAIRAVPLQLDQPSTPQKGGIS
ncbi:MAG: BREX-3 system phosphatase PglZ [Bacillota bacterium]